MLARVYWSVSLLSWGHGVLYLVGMCLLERFDHNSGIEVCFKTTPICSSASVLFSGVVFVYQNKRFYLSASSLLAEDVACVQPTRFLLES